MNQKNKTYKKNKKNKSYKLIKPVEKTENNNEKIFGLIHASWCGHCQQLMPVWKELKNDLLNNSNKNKIRIVEIESEDSDKDYKINELNQKYILNGDKIAIEGFPTIFKINGGKLEYFSNERDYETMKNWILQNPLVKQGGKNKSKRNKKKCCNNPLFSFFGFTK